MEFMDLPCVLNGWIFAQFGLYDFSLASNDKKYKDLLKKSLTTLKTHIQEYDCGYWSKYDEKKMIASPFYHKLHIAQLSALRMIDDSDIWKTYLNKFSIYQNSFWKRKRAFVVKAFQKIVGK